MNFAIDELEGWENEVFDEHSEPEIQSPVKPTKAIQKWHNIVTATAAGNAFKVLKAEDDNEFFGVHIHMYTSRSFHFRTTLLIWLKRKMKKVSKMKRKPFLNSNLSQAMFDLLRFELASYCIIHTVYLLSCNIFKLD